ncbi:MAG: hypothetical protein J6Y65_00960 [Eggerthellaceae bacterium]|nr:hypothetical protein [Eggerthellaceae bacterium]
MAEQKMEDINAEGASPIIEPSAAAVPEIKQDVKDQTNEAAEEASSEPIDASQSPVFGMPGAMPVPLFPFTPAPPEIPSVSKTAESDGSKEDRVSSEKKDGYTPPTPESLLNALASLPNVTVVDSRGGDSRLSSERKNISALTRAAEEIGIKAPEENEEEQNYSTLSGFDAVVAQMGKYGIGMDRDPEYTELVEKLNSRHGIRRVPAADTFLFVSESREDALEFALATAGELGLPAMRMNVTESPDGLPLLNVFVQNKKKAINAIKSELVGAGVLILEDIDTWMSPINEMPELPFAPFAGMPQMTRGAREALNLIRMATENPEVYVLCTAVHEDAIDEIFAEMIYPLNVVNVGKPTREERAELCMDIAEEHPSLRVINISQLVDFSDGLARFEIYAAARDAVEFAYKKGIEERRFVPITPVMIFERLAAFFPLDSEGYHRLEDAIMDAYASDFETIDSLLDDMHDADAPSED